MRDLKIVQLQYYTTEATAGTRLHRAFSDGGMNSNILSLYSEIKGGKGFFELGRNAKWRSIANNKIESYLTRNLNKKLGIFSFPVFGTDISKLELIKQADVIYIHWFLLGFLSLKNIEQLAKLKKPLVFVMHDMWTITGGCHHSFDCEKYMLQCLNCQFFPKDKDKDLSTIEFNRKQKLFSKYDNLYFISPSKWLYDCAKRSAITKNKPLFHIPNFLDTKMFKPFNKNVAKEILNIENGDKVIAFGAISIDSPYKGWKHLQKALKILNQDKNFKNITILIFGSGYNKEMAESISFKTKFVGFLNNDYAITLMYNAADVFVAPSLADNLPYTILEAESCGTPVVAFNIGGIPELIDHKKNGYLAAYKDSHDLAEGIKYCINLDIKGYALPQYDGITIVKKHTDLIDQIMN